MTNVEALKQAKYVFEHKGEATREERVNNARSLAEWKLFSNAQLSRLTGLDAHDIAEYTGKTDHSGGGLEGGALGPILNILENRALGVVDQREVRKALEHASTRMVARLTGLSQSTIARAGRPA